MLRTHGRCACSNIAMRPDGSWPGGKPLAVYVAVNGGGIWPLLELRHELDMPRKLRACSDTIPGRGITNSGDKGQALPPAWVTAAISARPAASGSVSG